MHDYRLAPVPTALASLFVGATGFRAGTRGLKCALQGAGYRSRNDETRLTQRAICDRNKRCPRNWTSNEYVQVCSGLCTIRSACAQRERLRRAFLWPRLVCYSTVRLVPLLPCMQMIFSLQWSHAWGGASERVFLCDWAVPTAFGFFIAFVRPSACVWRK